VVGTKLGTATQLSSAIRLTLVFPANSPQEDGAFIAERNVVS